MSSRGMICRWPLESQLFLRRTSPVPVCMNSSEAGQHAAGSRLHFLRPCGEGIPILRPLFPGKSFYVRTEQFTAFLARISGGPGEDAQGRWWLSLHESHMRFKIGPEERAAWLRTWPRLSTMFLSGSRFGLSFLRFSIGHPHMSLTRERSRLFLTSKAGLNDNTRARKSPAGGRPRLNWTRRWLPYVAATRIVPSLWPRVQPSNLRPVGTFRSTRVDDPKWP